MVVIIVMTVATASRKSKATIFTSVQVPVQVFVLCTVFFPSTPSFALLPALLPAYCVLHFLRRKMLVSVLEFRFRVQGSGFRVQGSGFRV